MEVVQYSTSEFLEPSHRIGCLYPCELIGAIEVLNALWVAGPWDYPEARL